MIVTDGGNRETAQQDPPAAQTASIVAAVAPVSKPAGPDLDNLTPEQARRRQEAYEQMKRIEREFDEIKKRLFDEKLNEIREEIQQVQSGTEFE
jgi:hypothetical protein